MSEVDVNEDTLMMMIFFFSIRLLTLPVAGVQGLVS